MPAFLRFLSLLLILFLPLGHAHAAGLPGLLGGSSKPQPEATEPLAQSLDDVIKNLENDQQRSKLLADLKKLRDATKQSQPTVEQGVLGLIGGALIGSFDRVFLVGMTMDSVNPAAKTIPEALFMLYQMTFAVITVAAGARQTGLTVFTLAGTAGCLVRFVGTAALVALAAR